MVIGAMSLLLAEPIWSAGHLPRPTDVPIDVLSDVVFAAAEHRLVDTLIVRLRIAQPVREIIRLRMEALDHLEPDEQNLVIAMIEGALLRHHARQL